MAIRDLERFYAWIYRAFLGGSPWSEVEIVRVLGAVYTVGNNTMLPGSVVAEADPMSFAPYAFMKVDDLKPKP
jgi:hypothetical protein